MATKQSRWLRLLSSNTSYDQDRLNYDQQKLRQFYLTQGYADFRVTSAVYFKCFTDAAWASEEASYIAEKGLGFWNTMPTRARSCTTSMSAA